ncbi:hypothetical protein PTKIN_Ptkin06aG0148300 [Pterospermum kingtungense]
MGNQMGCRPWSDLPLDILNLIIRRLPTNIDQIHFRLVCKNWHLAELPGYESNIPWLLSFHWHFDLGDDMAQLISFHIPSRSNRCQITKNMVEEELELYGAEICASKYGWLLLQKSDKAYFYNPFSRKAIKLPNMDIDFNRATFSSSPISPDCICFAIQSSKSSDKIRFSICSPGNLEWCTIEVDGFNKAVEDVVYSNGNFYCIFSGGILGAFCVASCNWSMLTCMEPIIEMQVWSRSSFVESNGELLLVFCSTNFHVYRFDWPEMGWIEIHKLGNQALFLGSLWKELGFNHPIFSSYEFNRTEQVYPL